MANPNDRAAVEEISTHLEKDVLPHVATESAVLAALGGAENDDADWSTAVEPASVKARRSGDVGGWSRLWDPPRFRAAALFRKAPRAPKTGNVLLATFPDLTEVTPREASSLEPPVDASIYDRVCLFSVHKQTVSGWMARGRSVVLEDLQSFSVSTDKPSLFADVGLSDSYVGAILENAANRELVQALADPAPTEVVAVPVRVKQRVIAYVVCDDPGHPASKDGVGDVVMASRKAGVAFEALILRKKLLS